jgi:hypothetical protein
LQKQGGDTNYFDDQEDKEKFEKSDMKNTQKTRKPREEFKDEKDHTDEDTSDSDSKDDDFQKPFPNKRKMERKYLFRDAKQDREIQTDMASETEAEYEKMNPTQIICQIKIQSEERNCRKTNGS